MAGTTTRSTIAPEKVNAGSTWRMIRRRQVRWQLPPRKNEPEGTVGIICPRTLCAPGIDRTSWKTGWEQQTDRLMQASRRHPSQEPRHSRQGPAPGIAGRMGPERQAPRNQASVQLWKSSAETRTFVSRTVRTDVTRLFWTT